MGIREQIVKYIKNLSNQDREKLKIMIEHNIICGSGIAEKLGISVEDFNGELKEIFKGG